MLGEALPLLASLAPAWPALAALLLGLLLIGRRRPQEHMVAHLAQLSLWLSLASVLLGAYLVVTQGGFTVQLGRWYSAGDYGFDVLLRWDQLSVPVGLLSVVLLLSTSRFSMAYLHREPGYYRFFLLMLTFAGGLFLLVLAGSYDLLFAGWEVVGLSSVLLVGFFHERTEPVRAAVRVLVTYRLCDVGLLLSALLLHLWLHSTEYTQIRTALGAGHGLPVTLLSLGFVLAAMGKSAQFPVGGWLPRAMEGPTASSAVFYGSLSVHAGVYLLLRAEPLLQHAPLVRALLVLIGGATAVMAALSGQASADAKSGLAYATISQVGLLFVECGLGWYRLCLLHLCAHALLRYYQFLRTPSRLQDALQRRAALGQTQPEEDAARWAVLRPELRRFVYRLALERFAVEAALERWLVQPVVALSAFLDRQERRLQQLGKRGGS